MAVSFLEMDQAQQFYEPVGAYARAKKLLRGWFEAVKKIVDGAGDFPSDIGQ